MTGFDWLLVIGTIAIVAFVAGVGLELWLSRDEPDHIYPTLTPKDYQSIRDEIARDRNPQVPPMRNPSQPDPPTTYTRKRKRNPLKKGRTT